MYELVVNGTYGSARKQFTVHRGSFFTGGSPKHGEMKACQSKFQSAYENASVKTCTGTFVYLCTWGKQNYWARSATTCGKDGNILFQASFGEDGKIRFQTAALVTPVLLITPLKAEPLASSVTLHNFLLKGGLQSVPWQSQKWSGRRGLEEVKCAEQ